MTDFQVEALELPTIDPRDEETLATQAQIRVKNKSGNLLNDFSDSSPITALLQGQAFAGSELLWYTNKVVPALAIQYLKNAGVERRLGTKAVVTLTFTLRAFQNVAFTIPAGFQVQDTSGQYTFTTNSVLVIPANYISGQVTATAAQVGTSYNLPAFTLNKFILPLSNLQSVTNPEPAQGGSDEETDASVVARGLAAIRRRGLVTTDDYEQEAKSILGAGSAAKAIPLLGPDKQTEQLGAVHLFALDASGQPITTAQIQTLLSQMQPKVHIGSSLYVSPMELLNILGEVVAVVTNTTQAETVAQRLWANYQRYLDRLNREAGDTLIHSEVEFALRSTSGIQYIDQLRLNNGITNVPMPNVYTIAFPDSLAITLSDSNGKVVFEGLYGKGDIE